MMDTLARLTGYGEHMRHDERQRREEREEALTTAADGTIRWPKKKNSTTPHAIPLSQPAFKTKTGASAPAPAPERVTYDDRFVCLWKKASRGRV